MSDPLIPTSVFLTIAHFLHPTNIGRFSRCSTECNKHMSEPEIWRDLYLIRFNFDPTPPWNSSSPPVSPNLNLPVPPFYKSAYASAHVNKHKLWIQHWNLVLPLDQDGKGRVCVPEVGDPRSNPLPSWDDVTADDPPSVPNPLDLLPECNHLRKICPTCRFHPLYEYGARHIHAHYDSEIFSDETIELILKDPEKAKVLQFSQYPTSLNQFEIDPVLKSEITAAAHSIAVSTGDLSSDDETKSGPYYSLSYSAAKATRFLKEKMCVDLKTERRVNPTLDFYNGVNYKVTKKAENAFFKCATRDRKINPNQYKNSGLHFLNDLVFLLAQPSEQRGNRKFETSNICSLQLYDDRLLATYERNQLELQSCATGTISGSLGPKGEIGSHSSHSTKFTNPLFEGILSWKILSSRRDAFSAYPVEGVLAPGESVTVNFYTRPLGSMMASAVDDVNTLRDASMQFARDVFQQEGYLPKVPFQVKYIILPQPPAVPPGYDPFLAETDVNDYCWRMAKPWEIGTINLEGHVNPAYALEDLERYALMPFEDLDHNKLDEWNAYPGRKFKGGFFHAPYLETRRRFARERKKGNPKYNDFDLGTDPERKRGDRKCMACKRSWNKRHEELGRNFQIKRLEGIGLGHLRRKEETDAMAALKEGLKNLNVIASRLGDIKNRKLQEEREEFEAETAGRAKKEKDGESLTPEEKRWIRTIWHCTHERQLMDVCMQAYRSLKSIADATFKRRTHPLSDVLRKPTLAKEIQFDMSTCVRVLDKLKARMDEEYQETLIRRKDERRTFNENWKKLTEAEQKKYIGKVSNAKLEYLEPIASPNIIFSSENEAIPKIYQFPRTTDFMNHIEETDGNPFLKPEFEKEWSRMLPSLTSLGGGGAGSSFIPMDKEGPGTIKNLEISAWNLAVALLVNPEALKGSVYKLAKPGE
ncbi:hypothetical protein TL16_g07100 [Triparma laevis f. inornata]|uniref:F-box domain-containing protein n=1 Tax=Triparma laevis f. inornata TaxID=1714386 RepID=A0A9W7AVY3_9STRA|nr:hypothetical protein TL16_g07100 [Triparma laevis f. inornata]